MPNKTFYIAKDVNDELSKEPNMGGLINKLLREHMKKVVKKVDDFATVGIRSEVEHVTTDEGIAHVVTPNKKDVKQFKQKIAEVLEFKPCKHGYDPKFCKYSKPGKPCK